MTPERLSPALERLKSRLDALLACFESERVPEPASMDAAWAPVLAAFEDLRSELGRAGELPPEVQERIRDCLRLYAVAAGELTRRREELVAGRAACAEARTRIRRREGGEPRGGSCDVRG